MDFANITLFNVMKAKLNFLSERQSVLAQNIANADTPQYQAMDVQEPDFQKMTAAAGAGPVRKLQMKTTNAKHITGHGGAEGAFKMSKRATSAERNPNGNNVVIEEEMSKVAQNQAEYQKVLNLYSKAVAMFKIATGNPTNGG